jgi:hypothetical protein
MNLDMFVMIWKEIANDAKVDSIVMYVYRKGILIFGWWDKIMKNLIDNNDENQSKMDISKMSDI